MFAPEAVAVLLTLGMLHTDGIPILTLDRSHELGGRVETRGRAHDSVPALAVGHGLFS